MQTYSHDKWTLVGEHPLLLEVQKRALKVAHCELPINIRGETGTGKELLARYIHRVSNRNKGAFVTVDCGVLTAEMARSELFGYVRGAFTGASDSRSGLVESARGGTLFLDEVGELSLDLQLQLLRLVQEREFRRVGEANMRRSDVRLITATHRNLREMVGQSAFREDLFYRLSVIPIHMPALRDRRSDLPLLIDHFCQLFKGTRRTCSDEALAALLRYNWPGNVRELQNEITRLMVMGESDVLEVADLPARIRHANCEINVFERPFKEARQEVVREFMHEYLHRALMRTKGNVSRAAQECGIGRQ